MWARGPGSPHAKNCAVNLDKDCVSVTNNLVSGELIQMLHDLIDSH